MSLLQVVLLAVVQGLTEFLPISSSAHLALAPWLLHWEDQGLTFDIALHCGTLAAVLIYFFRDWVQIVAQGFGLRYGGDPELKQNRKLLWLLAAGSLPIGFFGLLFKDAAENVWREDRLLIGAMLVGVGLLMALAERCSRRTRGAGDVNLTDAVVIGLAQALAIIPGTSRSGITITAGLFRHLDRAAAARFSFLLSTPAIAAAAAKALYDAIQESARIEAAAFAIGMAVSAFTGCLVIAFLLNFLRRHSLRFFIYYRVVFGLGIILLALGERLARW